MSVPFQPNPFEPLASYDVPGLAIKQLLDGEASLETLWDTFVRPNRLTPKQRDDIADGLKKRFGADKVSGAFLDVVTNPLVWLAFLTTPGGPTALRQSGKLFGGEFSSFVSQRFRALIGLETGWQLQDGTHGAMLTRAAAQRIKDNHLEVNEAFDLGKKTDALLGRINDRFGWKLKSLDPSAAKHADQKDYLEKLEVGLGLWSRGYDRSVATGGKLQWMPRFYLMKQGPDGQLLDTAAEIVNHGLIQKAYKSHVATVNKRGGRNFKIKAEDGNEYWVRAGDATKNEWHNYPLEAERTSRPLADLDLTEWLASEGALEMALATRQAQTLRFMRLMGKDKYIEDWELALARGEDWAKSRVLKESVHPDELLDVRKLESLARGFEDKDSVSRVLNDRWDSVRMLMSRNTRAAMLKKDNPLTRKEYVKALKDTFSSRIHLDTYMPKNTPTFYAVRKGRDTLEKVPESLIGNRDEVTALMKSTNRAQAREVEELSISSEALEKVKKHFPVHEREWQRQYAASVNPRTRSGDLKEKYHVAYDMDYWEPLRRYFDDTGRSEALHSWDIMRANPQKYPGLPRLIQDAQRESMKKARGVYATERLPRKFEPGAEPQDLDWLYGRYDPKAPPGGYSLSDGLEQVYQLIRTPATRPGIEDVTGRKVAEALRKGVWPAAFGTLRHEHGMTTSMISLGQAGLRWFHDKLAPTLFKALPESQRKEWLAGLKYYSELPAEQLTHKLLRNVSGHLYATHLGLNPGSVTLNLTQPLLHTATWVGGTNTLLAYRAAIAEMGKYTRLRTQRYGGRLRLTPNERRELVEESFKYHDAMGITGHLLEDIDRLALSLNQKKEGGLAFWSRDFPLKFFEKGEWLNRAVAAHAVERGYRQTGRYVAGKSEARRAQLMQDVERLVSETQFGAGPLNTPNIFLTNSFLGNPLIRQFMTFPLRTATGWFKVGPRIGKTRRFGIGDASIEIPWWLGDSFRAMGLSALAYEIGKAAVPGADLSRYGAVAASTELFTGGGGGRTQDVENPVPLPPVFDIGWSAIRGLLGADNYLFWNSVSRTIPGGVALFRATQHMPKLPTALEGMQRTYADWTHMTPEGLVPVYKGTGELVEFREPIATILGGLGVDLGAHRQGGNIDGYLYQQRDKIVRMRNDAMNALFANNMRRFNEVRARFEKEFGIPLTITKAQLARRAKSKSIPRTERMLEQMPSDVRAQYIKMVAASGTGRLDITPDELMSGPTASKRLLESERANAVRVTPEHLQLIQQLSAEAEERQQALQGGL